ncbi:uncharacterized protein LOC112638085 [Camponotus floridanus]|uniref:uncharacterized protein LOC112638085 n=1 Tax=Camponotus floridanus TaxID=104421 RepID=UPI000DC69F0B|nr:uncharacterized protein LOC112638085 [Camponotus floridanus]
MSQLFLIKMKEFMTGNMMPIRKIIDGRDQHVHTNEFEDAVLSVPYISSIKWAIRSPDLTPDFFMEARDILLACNTKNQQIEHIYMKESNLQYPANIHRRIEYQFSDVDNLQKPLHDISKMMETFDHKLSDLDNLKNHFNIVYSGKLHKIRRILLQSLYTDELNIEKQMDYEYCNIARSIKNGTKIMRKIQPNRRCEKIKFTIGMIVHIRCLAKRLAFLLSEINSHTGVIIGWHYKCNAWFVKKKLDIFAPHLSECCDTKNDSDHFCICRCQKSIYNTYIRNNPHYIILAENNILYYLPQDVLSICSPRWIDNVEIGRYFSKFEDTHYVPNESLAKEYPTDMAAFHEILPSIPQQCA